MANVSISTKNHDQNAPWWWKRLETALVFFFTGMIPLVGLTQSLPPAIKDDITLVVLPGLILAVKTFGILIGNPPVTDIVLNRDDVKDIEKVTKP